MRVAEAAPRVEVAAEPVPARGVAEPVPTLLAERVQRPERVDVSVEGVDAPEKRIAVVFGGEPVGNPAPGPAEADDV